MRVRILVRILVYILVRTLRSLGLAAFLSAAVAAGAVPACAQLGFDRPGGDYASAPVPSGDPAVCAARCEHDKACRSWSFSYMRVLDQDAVAVEKQRRAVRDIPGGDFAPEPFVSPAPIWLS